MAGKAKTPAKKSSKAAPARTTEKRDVYAEVTDKIVAALEAGARPWSRSWNSLGVGHLMPMRANGMPYSGINVLLLWVEAQAKGYTQRRWMTYGQAQKLKGQVRKGEKSTMVVKAGTFLKEVEDPKKPGQMKKVPIPFMKPYSVFNLDQIDWSEADPKLVERIFEKPDGNKDATVSEEQRMAEVDAFFKATGATLHHGGDRAFYSPDGDFIRMPEFSAFHTATDYYATLGHEHIHWTKGGSDRLTRDFGKQRFGDQGYAMEELVAELGAAFLCAELGLTAEPREDHASYLASWLKVLKNDKKAIFTAASKAKEACEFLYRRTGRIQPEPVEDGAEDSDGSSTTMQMMAA
jgi:antirestriction protein ArdC